MALDLSPLKKAIGSLASAIEVVSDKHFMRNLEEKKRRVLQAGVIQNFEFTYELCWKMIQRWLRINFGDAKAEPRTRKDLFRYAFQSELIQDPKTWFRYTEARNSTSHTYNEVTAAEIFEISLQFLPDARYLLAKLEQMND